MAGSDWETGTPRGVSQRLVGAAGIAAIALLLVALLQGGRGAVDPDQELTIEDRDQAEATEVAPAGVEVGARQPLQYANSGWWFCPPAAPFAAHIDRRFYPPTHPGPPPEGRRPAACYGDRSSATTAGYSLAPPPADTQIVGGIYLVPTKLFRLRCQAGADALGHAVPCPRRLPYPPRTAQCTGVGPVGCVVRRPSGASFVIEAQGFPVPPGRCPCEASVVVAAARTGRLRQPASASAGARSMRRWRSAGVTYAVSVAGVSDAQRALLRAVVDGIEMVPPSMPGQGS